MAFLGVKRQKYLGIDDFNKLLRNIKGLGYKIIYGPYLKGDTFHTLCDTAFIEDKISLHDRDLWPIVTDSVGNIVWIPGLKKSKFDKSKQENYDIIMKYC